jgi:hypothetical protein
MISNGIFQLKEQFQWLKQSQDQRRIHGRRGVMRSGGE